MSKLLTTILSVLLLFSVSLNVYWYFYPNIEKIKGETVYLPGEKKETVVYRLPEGNQSATVQNIPDYDRATAAARELLATVKGIPDLENEKKITQLIASNMKLELSLSEKDLALNDKEKQIKTWSDKYNSITVDNLNNTSSVMSEVNPKIATVEKREKFYLPKESYTVITSENPSIKFYGIESYQFKNPRQKDFVELNLKVQGLYINKQIIPYGGAELLFNPNGKLKPIVGYGYFYNNGSGKLFPYWIAGLQFNLIRF